jgi:hypothetical protein
MKPTHGKCEDHRWGRWPVMKSQKSIGSVSVWQCDNCLTVRVEQVKVGHVIEPAVVTLLEIDSAYPYVGAGDDK